MKKPKVYYVYRSAVTGCYVSAAYAKRRPPRPPCASGACEFILGVEQ